MATYNSAQAGNWNTDATWTEAGHPDTNDDVIVITHMVDYNVGLTGSGIDWGNVTINSGGTLDFPINGDSTLKFNVTGVLTVGNGGKLSCGSLSTPIDKAYKLNIYWPNGAAVRDVLELTDGGEIALYGDPDFYGSEKYANLDSNWTSGQTFYITGNYSSKWQAGQKFLIHKNGVYTSYLEKTHIFTIATVGSYDTGNDRTPITITEAAPDETFAAIRNKHQSKLIMLSRNIELADYESNWDINGYVSYSEKIKFDNNQAIGTDLIRINNAIMRGWYYGCDGGYNYNGKDMVVINNLMAFRIGKTFTLEADFVSNEYGIYAGDNYHIIGDFVSNEVSILQGKYFHITGDFVNNLYGIVMDPHLL